MRRTRKFFWHYIYLIIILFISFVALTLFLERKINHSFIEHNKMILQESGRSLLNTFQRELLQNPEKAETYAETTVRGTNFRITIILPGGEVIADSHNNPENMNNHADRPEIVQAADDGRGQSVRFSTTETRHFFYSAFRIDSAGFFRLAVPVERIFEITGNLSFLFISSAAVVFVLFTGISLLSLRSINKSVAILRTAAEEYSRGNLEHRSYVEGPQELSLLASSMNAMSENLRESLSTEMRQRSEQEAILSNMTESVILLDSDLCVKTINESGLRLLETDPASVSGKSLIDVMRNSELHAFAEHVLRSNGDSEISLSLYRLGDKKIQNPPVDLEIHGSVISVKGKTGKGVLLVFHDITRLKMLERIRKDFVANVSHELKTPITSIKGFVETLKTIPPEDAAQSRRFLDIIDKHTERLRLIIDDLLTISRLEQYPESGIEKGEVSLPDIIQTAVQNCRKEAGEKNISISVEAGPVSVISGSKRLLEQALTNLIENAVKYSSHGTAITIRYSALAGGGAVQIDVIDTGQGIPRQHLNRIFERFYRVEKSRSREEGGTGLGLSIVKHIAMMHGGKVLVESEPGKGSTFSLVLPN